MPERVATNSALTSTTSDTPRLMRRPAKMVGSAPGRITRRKSLYHGVP